MLPFFLIEYFCNADDALILHMCSSKHAPFLVYLPISRNASAVAVKAALYIETCVRPVSFSVWERSRSGPEARELGCLIYNIAILQMILHCLSIWFILFCHSTPYVCVILLQKLHKEISVTFFFSGHTLQSHPSLPGHTFCETYLLCRGRWTHHAYLNKEHS